MEGTHQRVDVPMGAYISSGITLCFHNLCSVVRVHVSNTTNAPLPITRITITAERAYLSGAGTAIITGDSTDAIVMPTRTGSHSVNLCKPDNTPMKTVEPLATEYFDLIVPEFSARNNLTVTVATPTGSKTITLEDAAVAHNTITNVAINMDELSQPAAELVHGHLFCSAISQNATAVRFEYNNATVTSGTILSTDASPYPIYGNMDGTIWVVSTPANSINANANCMGMFDHPAITNIDFGDHFNTTNVTNMASMFDGCNSLTSLDLSNFNTTNVTNMAYMFYKCLNLTSLDLSSFNTENVEKMSNMFNKCFNLTSLNLSSFNTENVTNMECMFDSCYSLTNLDISSFNTENVITMWKMFSNCRSLTSLDLTSFNTENVIIMSCMFDSCISLTNLDISSFNTGNVTLMWNMFNNCCSLSSIDLSNFNTSNVKVMGEMFSGCSNLTSLDLSSFRTEKVEDMSGMFSNCSRLTSLNLYNFDMSGVYVYGKDRMCYNLASESGACTITCPTAVQTELQSGTDLDNSIITWNTH